MAQRLYRLLFLLLLSIIITACFGPVKFAHLKAAQQFGGVFSNSGKSLSTVDSGASGGQANAMQIYLSGLLWPDVALNHAQIDRIEVQSETPGNLRVVALQGTQEVYASNFLEGRHFVFNDNYLKLIQARQTSGYSGRILGFMGGQPLLGMAPDGVRLGLDGAGDVRLASVASMAHMGLMLLPVAAGDSVQVVFVRLSE